MITSKQIRSSVTALCSKVSPGQRFTVAVIIIVLYGVGCQAMGLMPTQPSGDLTPEQIEAYGKAGAKVYKCFTLAGPPPAGGVAGVILPKEDKSTVKFLPGCHISMQ